MYKKTFAAVGAVGVIALAVSGCSSSGGTSGGAGSTPADTTTGSGAPMSSSMPSSMSSSSSAMSSAPAGGGATATQPFGSACSAVPKTGAGSFNGMMTDPAATAASHNPVLSTLVTAVTKAGLVDTVNSAPALTIFAPYNGAFAKIPSKTLNSVLANKAELTKILTYHVLAGKIAPAQLAGKHKTLEGATVDVTGSGTSFKVGPTGKEANVICGNVQTANATVYVIDSVMMPPMKG
jgi:uncharacterized surface protein with fasciclin (FAS1) repeats